MELSVISLQKIFHKKSMISIHYKNKNKILMGIPLYIFLFTFY
jgi:hypothetical protein